MARMASLLARVVPLAPRRLVAGIAARYVAGDDLASALRTAHDLDAHGILATIDLLGEAVVSDADADAATEEYVDALRRLGQAGLDPHVSVKPTGLGSSVDWDACGARVRRIVAAADDVGGLVNIDMEDASTTDGTLALYRALRDEGRVNVAVVVQARLRRTASDLASLAPLAPHVRICKGIYPESESIALTDADAIRASYVACLEMLLASGGYAAIATHDMALVRAALDLLRGQDRDRESYEFQTLLGVREPLAAQLAADGHRVRTYVPYGPEWYEYATRRIQESPHVAGYVARDVLARTASQTGSALIRGARAATARMRR